MVYFNFSLGGFLTYIVIMLSLGTSGARKTWLALEHSNLDTNCNIYKPFALQSSSNGHNNKLIITNVTRTKTAREICCYSQAHRCDVHYLLIIATDSQQLTSAGRDNQEPVTLNFVNKNFVITIYHSVDIIANIVRKTPRFKWGHDTDFCELFKTGSYCRKDQKPEKVIYTVKNARPEHSGLFSVMVKGKGTLRISEEHSIHIRIGQIKLDENVVVILEEPMPIAFEVCSPYDENPNTEVSFTPLYYDSGLSKLESPLYGTGPLNHELFPVGAGCFVGKIQSVKVSGKLDVKAWTAIGTETAYAYVYVRNFTDEIVLEIPSQLTLPLKVRCLVDIYKYTNALTFEFGGNEMTVLATEDGYVWSASITLSTVDGVVSCTAKSKAISGGFVRKKVNLMEKFNVQPVEDAVVNITLFGRGNVLLNCTPSDWKVSWYKNGLWLNHREGTLNITLERREKFAVIACSTKIHGQERSTTWYIQVHPQFQWFPTGVLICFGAIGTLLVLLVPMSYLKSSRMSNMKDDRKGTEMEALSATQEHVPQIPPEYEFSKDILRFRRKLGDGVFGVIMMAKAVAIVPREPSTAVAVHIVANVECDSVMHVLIAELKMMIEVGQHLNIVNFLGAITTTVRMGELMVMYEYCPYGTLQEFLWQNRANFISRPLARWFQLPDEDPAGMPQSYTTQDLHCFASQIANGMAYLISRRILHGSLMARKIMLCEKRVVKICCIGLTRTMFRSSVFKRTEGETTAHKWLALESFSKLVFNAKTDVWAFGVVLWEIFSLGATPYAGMSSPQIVHRKLLDGYRLEKPEHTNRELYDIMLSCWYVNPTLRPTFERLTFEFHRLLSHRIRDFYKSLNEPHMRANARRIARQQGRTPEEDTDDDDFRETLDNSNYMYS